MPSNNQGQCRIFEMIQHERWGPCPLSSFCSRQSLPFLPGMRMKDMLKADLASDATWCVQNQQIAVCKQHLHPAATACGSDVAATGQTDSQLHGQQLSSPLFWPHNAGPRFGPWLPQQACASCSCHVLECHPDDHLNGSDHIPNEKCTNDSSHGVG